MSRSDWITLGAAAVAVALGFLLGGTLWGVFFLVLGAVFFFIARRPTSEKEKTAVPELFLQYSPNVPNALYYSGFFLCAENDRKACNVEISSEDTVGDNHVKLGMKWESPGHPVGKDTVPLKVQCVYYKDGRPHPYGGLLADQINLFFQHKKENPRELIVTLNYTDVEGNPCPPRKFKVTHDVWADKISCEPIKQQIS